MKHSPDRLDADHDAHEQLDVDVPGGLVAPVEPGCAHDEDHHEGQKHHHKLHPLVDFLLKDGHPDVLVELGEGVGQPVQVRNHFGCREVFSQDSLHADF